VKKSEREATPLLGGFGWVKRLILALFVFIAVGEYNWETLIFWFD
jgi:hypothetical protein